MRFSEAGLAGAYLVRLERHEDERGFFARTFCEREFAERGLVDRYPQCNLSWNRARGTLRGMHYNAAAHREAKLVRCSRGAIHDVILDLREGSATRGRWAGFELDAAGGASLYVPAGFAHGFLTLRDGTDVFYQMGAFYKADAARGMRWNDPRVGIAWPVTPATMSDRDRTYPDLDVAALEPRP